MPSSSETSVKSSAEASKPRDHRLLTAASIAVVSSPPSPRASDRLTVGRARQLGEHAAHVLDRGAAASPASQSSGRKSRPDVSFG